MPELVRLHHAEIASLRATIHPEHGVVLHQVGRTLWLETEGLILPCDFHGSTAIQHSCLEADAPCCFEQTLGALRLALWSCDCWLLDWLCLPLQKHRHHCWCASSCAQGCRDRNLLTQERVVMAKNGMARKAWGTMVTVTSGSMETETSVQVMAVAASKGAWVRCSLDESDESVDDHLKQWTTGGWTSVALGRSATASSKRRRSSNTASAAHSKPC